MLEDYFKEFRENTIGYNQAFNTCYGETKMVYSDWTASGRLYGPIEDKIRNTFGPFVGNTHSQSSETGMLMTKSYNLAREKIKKHVNAYKSDTIINAGFGVTSVVNKLQRILGLRISEKLRNYIDVPNEMKPVIFITHMEHHSNQISWLETYSDVICVEPNEQGLVDLENLDKLLKKYSYRKYKIGAFTACSNVTGIETPYHEMAKIMHEHDGICFIDFAASAPYVNINMHPDNSNEKLDGIFFSPHKFLGGPGSSGVLIFDSKLYSNNTPDDPGGGTVNWTNPWGEYKYISDIESREDGGTPGFLQAIRTALCIELKEKMKVENMLNREKEIINILFTQLRDIKGLHILADNITSRLGILSFYVDNIHYNLLIKILSDRFGIQIRGGCSCAGTYGHYLLNISKNQSNKITRLIDSGDLSHKPGWARISTHPVMTDEEIYYIVDSIKSTVENIKEWGNDYSYIPNTNEFKNKNSSVEKKNIEQWFKF